MAVTNNQRANETTFNNAFLSRTRDSTTIARVGLLNTLTESGASITNLQRELNAILSFIGSLPNQANDYTNPWTNNQVGASTDSVAERLEAITARFKGTAGHAHTGADGEGSKVSAADLANVPLTGAFAQGVALTGVTGSSTDISTQMAGKTPSHGSSQVGVVSDFPYNKIQLRQASGADQGEYFRDGAGNLVFARLTEISGVWTLSYFVNLAGTETAYSFGSAVDVDWYFQSLYNPMVNPPTYDLSAFIPSENATQDVVDASGSQRGVVSTGAQTFAGAKTFSGNVVIQGTTTLAAALGGVLKAAAGVVSAGLVNLASEITGVLGVANGGTGKSSVTAGTVLIGNGTGAMTEVAPGTLGNVLQSDGTNWISGAASAGGGGGGALVWYESDLGPAPRVVVDGSAMRTREFGLADTQDLYCMVKVPATYSTGKPAKMYLPFYIVASSGAARLEAKVAHVRQGQVVSGVETYTSTNAAFTATGPLAGTNQKFILDLTSSIGQIASTNIAPGDILRVRLHRDSSDTANAPIYAATDAAEVTFS